jgi:Nucleoside-diphosphate-sugar epimerases
LHETIVQTTERQFTVKPKLPKSGWRRLGESGFETRDAEDRRIGVRGFREEEGADAAAMNVLVTGAGGFIGRALVDRLLSSGVPGARPGAQSRLVLVDLRLTDAPSDPRILAIEGDFADERVLHEALRPGIDLVFHLASVPGGRAEQDFDLGLRVNLHGTIALLDAVRRDGRCPRFVFASTIGVYGVPLPDRVDEHTLPEPTMSYGAQKLIGEILLTDYSRRGFIDGCAVRLPGIVARPPAETGMLSAFLSDAVRTLSAGKPFTFPVAADGRSWWMSRSCAVDNLLHAATLDAGLLQSKRVWLLPVLHASMQDVVRAIARVHGDEVLGIVSYEPNPALQAQFASYPPLHCQQSIAAGFRHDGTLEALVQRALE